MREIASDHTSIVIAHRLSTIVDAHELIVLEQGATVEEGTYAQLLALQGRHAQISALQL